MLLTIGRASRTFRSIQRFLALPGNDCDCDCDCLIFLSICPDIMPAGSRTAVLKCLMLNQDSASSGIIRARKWSTLHLWMRIRFVSPHEKRQCFKAVLCIACSMLSVDLASSPSIHVQLVSVSSDGYVYLSNFNSATACLLDSKSKLIAAAMDASGLSLLSACLSLPHLFDMTQAQTLTLCILCQASILRLQQDQRWTCSSCPVS